MTRGEHRRSGGHEHRHRGSHRHSDAHAHTFSEGGNSGHSTLGSVGGGGGGFGGGEGHGHSLAGHDHGPSTAMDATFVWKLSKLGRIGSSRLRFDDDFADRLNYQYTGVLMFLFIGLIGIRQYVGKPIQCWIPQEFTRGWEEYAENYCWVSNTYFAPIQDRLPPAPNREAELIGYYQWAPIVMAIQAMAFYLPCLIWRLFMTQSGFNVRRILQMACDSNVLLPEHTMKNVRFIARYMEGCIYRQRDYRRRPSIGFSPISYTGLGHSHQHTPHQTRCHTHHAHFPHAQLHPAFLPPTHAPPPIYSSGTSPQLHTTNRHSPSNQSRGNGETAHLKSASHKRKARRSNNSSLLDRLRLRLSVNNELAKSDGKLKTHQHDSSLDTLDEHQNGQGNEEHPMLGRSKAEEAPMNLFGLQNPNYISGPNGCYRSATQLKRSPSTSWGCCGKQHGNYLVVLYFFVKLLYLTNIVCQLFMMEKFVGAKHSFYGPRVLMDLINGREWYHSGNFPRVTFCDFEAKKLGKNHKYTLQCVLPLNMFLEKIYIFLWFWHCTIGVITLGSFVVWFYRMGFPNRRVKFIRKYLKIMSVLCETDKVASTKFVENYLRPDGVFLIRLVAINVGDLMAGDLTCELWHIYRHKRLHELHEEQKLLETGADFVLSSPTPTVSAPVFPGDVGGGSHSQSIPIGDGAVASVATIGRRSEKNHHSNNNNNNAQPRTLNNVNGSSNNDDSIV